MQITSVMSVHKFRCKSLRIRSYSFCSFDLKSTVNHVEIFFTCLCNRCLLTKMQCFWIRCSFVIKQPLQKQNKNKNNQVNCLVDIIVINSRIWDQMDKMNMNRSKLLFCIPDVAKLGVLCIYSNHCIYIDSVSYWLT